MSGVRTFNVEIRRSLDASLCEALTDEEAYDADEAGELGGNRFYQDLRCASWEQVASILSVEGELVSRIAGGPDPAAAEAEFIEQRDTSPDVLEGLCGLDVGVASAAHALSALGAIPFMSCNAGSFGNHHPAAYPYVAFYLSTASVDQILTIAADADVGLEVTDGRALLYARSILDLLLFARLATERAR